MVAGIVQFSVKERIGLQTCMKQLVVASAVNLESFMIVPKVIKLNDWPFDAIPIVVDFFIGEATKLLLRITIINPSGTSD